MLLILHDLLTHAGLGKFHPSVLVFAPLLLERQLLPAPFRRDLLRAMLTDNLTTKCAFITVRNKLIVLLDLVGTHVGLGAAHDGLGGTSRVLWCHLSRRLSSDFHILVFGCTAIATKEFIVGHPLLDQVLVRHCGFGHRLTKICRLRQSNIRSILKSGSGTLFLRLVPCSSASFFGCLLIG